MREWMTVGEGTSFAANDPLEFSTRLGIDWFHVRDDPLRIWFSFHIRS